jgi:type I restriction-modification system DNA methylase subunit
MMSSTFSIDAEEIAKEIVKVAQESISEEDLKQGVEYIIKRNIIERIKEVERTEIPHASWKPPGARYEVTLVSGIRPDALYGHLIIEYEKPKTFETRSGFEKAVEQVKRYIIDHAEVEARFPRYFGVVLDGYKIGFVRYREVIKDFESRGAYYVNKNTVAKLIEAIIGLRRKALGAEELLKDFGPESQVASESIRTFYSKLLKTSPRTQMLFEDWKRVFSQVCAYSPEKIKGLEETYGFKKADPEKLLFALHTYYALIMKLLAAEVASLYMAPKLWSYLRTLEEAYYRGHDNLREGLRELEEGGVFVRLGIVNFMEADYFAWYLDEWDKEVAKCVISIVDKLSNYDPSAAELEPEKVKDLFKRLYQNLVPKKIRHDLGEYYTPDWLAELVLNEVGWTSETFEKLAQEKGSLAPLDLRLLDPACGSGTFLVLAISRLRGYVEEHWIDKGGALKRITKNIVGFDLNPLAVIASRANYLITLGDMLRERGAEPIEIPIYLADSILVERRQTLTGATYILKTAVGEFSVPISVVEKGLLTKILTIMEECVRGHYSSSEFRARLQREVSLEENEAYILIELFEMLSKLEREGKNRIWTRILKNSFAPFFAGKFDYVVGNPPWVHWRNLPKTYRDALKALYEEYNILPSSQYQPNVDFSMLFVYRCFDKYLTDCGNFGFLITQIVFRSFTGEGFLRFKIKNIYIKILKVHDLVEIKPFEGAQNRTAIMIALKDKMETEYPIPYVIWRKSGHKIDQILPLKQVLEITTRQTFWCEPLGGYRKHAVRIPPFACLPKKDSLIKLRDVIGPSYYEAHKGVDSIPSGVYWVKALEKQEDFIIVQNISKTGKIGVKEIVCSLEKDLLFPVIRGRNISEFKVQYEHYIVVPHDVYGRPINEATLKEKYPKVYNYFKEFEEVLKDRADFKERGKNKPFYFLYRLSDNSFAPYKVVWRDISTNIQAVVIGIFDDKYLGSKPVIPDQTIIYIPCKNEDEAHFICALLNSSLIRYIVRSYHHLHLQPQILEQLKIPKFNFADLRHTKLAELSKKAHQLAQQNKENELKRIKEEIDKIVAQLYNISEDELREIKTCLTMLEGEEFEEGEEEVADLPSNMPALSLRNNVVEENKPFNVEVVISNPLDKPLTNISVKLKLFDGRFIEKNFERIQCEASFPLSFSGLKSGEYKVEAVFEYLFENTPNRIEKELTIYIKGSGVKHVERSFKLEELWGV